MKAGHELDNALIAEKVMGWVMHPSWGCLAPPGYPSEEEMWTPWVESWDDEDKDFIMTRQPIKGKFVPGVVMDGSGKPKIPDYLGGDAAAMQVAVHMTEQKLCYFSLSKDENGWDAWFTDLDPGDHVPTYDGRAKDQDTASLAICLAAWEAVKEREK